MTESRPSPQASSARFHCLVARARDVEAAERALAEAVAVGAAGAEQRESADGVTLLLYAPVAASGAVARALAAVLGAAAVEPAVELEARDWSRAWRAGLRAVEVSPRLRVRPSFDATPGRPGQRDLVIDPGQAFGTGGHESTRLALAWLDAVREELAGPAGVLDVGTGTGVLALAALALGAERALGFDLDPLAAPAALANARANRLAARLALVTGTLDALSAGRRFRGVVANLLRRELEPLAPALAARVQAEGWVVISGLLDSEVAGWSARCAGAGLVPVGERHATDASGTRWTALLMRPRAAGAASRARRRAAASR